MRSQTRDHVVLSRCFTAAELSLHERRHACRMPEITTLLAVPLALIAAAVFAAMIWAGNHTH